MLNRAAGRDRIFRKTRDYEAFQEVLAEAKQRLPMRVLAWCVMPSHWHLALWPRGDGDLSEFMRWLTVTHTHALARGAPHRGDWPLVSRTLPEGPLAQRDALESISELKENHERHKRHEKRQVYFRSLSCHSCVSWFFKSVLRQFPRLPTAFSQNRCSRLIDAGPRGCYYSSGLALDWNMVFTVSDFNDFKQLLLDHPAWQVEVRRLLLSEDFEALPGIVRRLAEAQERFVERQNSTEQRLARLEKVVAELAEAQKQTEQRLAHLEKVVAELAEALRQLTLRVDAMAVTLAKVNGRTLEGEYREKAPAYFGRWIRRTIVVARTALEEELEERLSDDELHDALLIDLVVRGRLKGGPQSPEVYLAVEVSSVVDREDVSRAVRSLCAGRVSRPFPSWPVKARRKGRVTRQPARVYSCSRTARACSGTRP